MNKYRVHGTIEHNFEIVVEADSADEAGEQALMFADDGTGLGAPTGEAEVTSIEKIPAPRRKTGAHP